MGTYNRRNERMRRIHKRRPINNQFTSTTTTTTSTNINVANQDVGSAYALAISSNKDFNLFIDYF